MLQKEWFHNFIGKVKIDVCLFVCSCVCACVFVRRAFSKGELVLDYIFYLKRISFSTLSIQV